MVFSLTLKPNFELSTKLEIQNWSFEQVPSYPNHIMEVVFSVMVLSATSVALSANLVVKVWKHFCSRLLNVHFHH